MNGKTNVAVRLVENLTPAEVVLFRLVRDGYVVEATERSIRLKRRDGEPVALGAGLRESVSKHKQGIRMLLHDVSPEQASRLFGDVMEGLAMKYPRGVGCDLSAATEILERSQRAYRDGDIALWRYRLHVGCKRALAICEAHAGMDAGYEQASMV